MNMGYVILADTAKDIVMNGNSLPPNLQVPKGTLVQIEDNVNDRWETEEVGREYLEKLESSGIFENCRLVEEKDFDTDDLIDVAISVKRIADKNEPMKSSTTGDKIDVLKSEEWAEDIWVLIK